MKKDGFRLVTSNDSKLTEFREFGLSLERVCIDLPEIDGDPEQVVLYKSAAAGPGTVIEDTSLSVEGEDIGVNIRWLMDSLPLHVGKTACWKVMIGINDGTHVEIYEGSIQGVIVKEREIGSHEKAPFGFDSVFVPKGTNKTLYDLGSEKRLFSARKAAIESMLHEQPKVRMALEEMEPWTGSYQKGL